MYQYRTEPITGSLTGQSQLSNIIDHLEVWHKKLLVVVLDSGAYIIDIDQELTEEERTHLNLEVV